MPKPNYSRLVKIFLIGSLFGYIFTRLFESASLWSNANTLLFGVPIKIIIAWGASLLLLYIITDSLVDKFGEQFKWVVYIPSFMMVGITVEYIGFQILKIQPLNDMPPLIPMLDIWHASPWLYVGYGLTALVFIEFVRNIENKLDKI